MRRHTMSFAAIAVTMIAMMGTYGCSSKVTTPTGPDQDSRTVDAGIEPEVQREIDALRQVVESPDGGFGHWTEGPTATVVVPAGSVDALADAVAAAGRNGIVVLESGMHTENGTVTVTFPVKIIGEKGAVLKSATTFSNDIPMPILPAIHVLGARGVVIANIEFKPVSGVANTGILLERSPRSLVARNRFSGLQISILSHYSDFSTIMGNTVVASQGGDVVESDGIINVNGSNVRIVDNDVSNGLLNVFCSGAKGVFLHNKVHGGFVGMILCKVPAGSYLLPSGAVVGSDISGTGWFAQGNNATGNEYVGYLVIDGANRNLLVNNGASGNGAYDLELLGETCLFGFSTPTSFRNTVVVGSHKEISINDFGVENRILGALSVTHNITAPCP